MSMSMLRVIHADGAEHNVTPLMNFEEAVTIVAPSQYLALRVLDLFDEVKVHGFFEADPGRATISPEAASQIRSENARSTGPAFDLRAAREDPRAAPVHRVGSCPRL